MRKKNGLISSQLDSGLQVVTLTMPHLKSVSAGLFSRVGARFETPQQMGIAHFVEHMLFKGSQHYSSKQISELIEGSGGFLNAYTAEEHSCFYFKTIKKSLFSSLDVLIDFYTSPEFSKEEIEKEKEVILEEILSYEDNPSQAIDDLFASLIWQNHPLGHFILGEKELIQGLTQEELVSFFQKHYTAQNTVLAVAGAITHEELLEWIRPQEGRFLQGKKNHCQPFLLSQEKMQVKNVVKDLEQCHLQLGVPCFGRQDSRQEALYLLNTIAGENMSSRLFQEIRERQGLAYHIASSVELYEEVGFFALQCSLDPEKVNCCIEESLKVLKGLQEVSEFEVERAKGYLIGHTLQESENSLSAMLWIGERALNQEEDLSFEGFSERLEAVTQQEVETLAQSLFETPLLNLSMIGPTPHSDEKRKDAQ